MYIKSIFLLALATGIVSADLFSLGTSRVPTSLALGGTFLAGVLTTVPAGVNAGIIARHHKKHKPSDEKKDKAAAKGTGAAAAKKAAATGTAGGVCNGTAATAGDAQGGKGNHKRAYGLPIYPRHKGKNFYWTRLFFNNNISVSNEELCIHNSQVPMVVGHISESLVTLALFSYHMWLISSI